MMTNAAIGERIPDDAQLKALVATFTNPLPRGILLAVLRHPGMSSAEIAEHLGVPVQSVRRQLKSLIEGGLVGVQGSEVSRGLTRLYYAGLRSLWTGDEEDAKLSDRQRRRIDLQVGKNIFRAFSRAISAPGYGTRPGRMVARDFGLVDERAWAELSELQHELLRRSRKIIEAGQERIANADGTPVEVFTALLLMELPGPDSADTRKTLPDSGVAPRRAVTA